MATPSSPTARRYELARRLKELREEAGKSLADVAEELACSLAKASRIETGQRAVQALDIKVLSRFYNVSPQVQEALTELATEARKRGWWQDFRTLNEQTQTFIGLESAAVEAVQFEALRMPGLLQTPDYTRAWVTAMRPPGFWDDQSIDDIVAARQRRQLRIETGELRLPVVIDEAAFLHRASGAASIMTEQVQRLITAAALPNVTVQVILLAAGPHPGLDGSFQLLRLAGTDLSDFVFVEGQFGNLILDKVDMVSRYRNVFDHLSSSVALSPEDTLTWLHRHAEHLKTADSATSAPFHQT
jgi:Helix-turn-helix.